MSIWGTVMLIIIYRQLLDVLPISGFHWGSPGSKRPGFWWTKTETIYVRKIGDKS